MKKAIVLGGGGFVGNAVVRELLARGVAVTVIARPGYSKNADTRLKDIDVEVLECTLENISLIPDIVKGRTFDVWYQFAWDGLFNEPLLDYSVQTANIKYVMDSIVTAKHIGCERFIGSGSISQYELRTLDGQTNRHDKHRVYKTAKLACEYMGRSVATMQSIKFFWPIITNIYGEGEKSPRLINTMIRKLLDGKHQALSEGNQIYDFIHISDAARAFADIGFSGVEYRTYVIGSGGAKPLKEFLTELRDIVNPDAELGFGEMEFNGIYLDQDDYSIEQLSKDTGFLPKLTFAQGIQQTSAWIKSQI